MSAEQIDLWGIGEPAPVLAAAPERHTEASMLERLRTRYTPFHGNGPRWAFATHVRSGAGFDAERTADAVAMDLWPSKGMELHGHEVKVSRSDWLCELRDPTKAVPVQQYMDRWWLVVPDRALVAPGELPATWGLMVASGTGLRVVKAAPRLDPKPLSRSFTGALLRAAVKTEQRRAAREAKP